MTRKICVAVAAALAAGAMLPAQADTQLGDYVTLSGFGTFGAVVTDSDQGEFGKDRQPGGADKDPEYWVDTNLGVQATVRANRWLSGTVQLLAARRDHRTPRIDAEWAFIKVQPIDNLSIRVGRTTMPTFLVSDFRNVGYANTWLRAPNEVYALAAFRRLEGADVSYRLNLGSSSLTAQVLGGESKFFNMGAWQDVKRVRGGNLTWERDGITVRAGRMEAAVIVEGFPDSDFAFTGIGASYDRGNVVAQAEFVKRREGSDYFGPMINADAFYVMGGYRFGSVTPYASLARTTPKTRVYEMHFSDYQETKALGVRWDAFSSAAIKFQVEQIDTEGTAGISFATPVSGTVNAFSASIDFTF